MTTLSVVIPAYNEEDGIADIVERVLAIRPALAAAGVDDLECIVVDDGSRDRTAAIVRERFGERVNLICQKNKGYGGALKTGFRAARGELLGFLDADSTYPPEYFPQLCQAAFGGADLVIGSRMSGERSEMPLVRRVGNFIFANLLSLVAGVKISDSASGQRVIRREALPALYPLPDTLDFTPAMSTRALHENLRMVEVPIPYKERSGRSKLSVVRDGLRFFKSIVWTALTYNPVRIFGGLGVVALVVALLVMGLELGLVLTGAAGWSFPMLFGALVLLVGGVTLYTTGTSFSYIVRLFHKRDIRQGLVGRHGNGRRLERHYWWLGFVAVLLGVAVYITAAAFNLTDPAVFAAAWFAPVVSALMVLTGVQLVSAWGLARMLAELSVREGLAARDLQGDEAGAGVADERAAYATA